MTIALSLILTLTLKTWGKGERDVDLEVPLERLLQDGPPGIVLHVLLFMWTKHASADSAELLISCNEINKDR